MTAEKWIPILEKELGEFMKTAPKISVVHKTDHVRRVWKTSKRLCGKLGGDLETMAAAVFLHDLGRHYGLEIHGEKSAELAELVLTRLGFPKQKVEDALDAIRKHDYDTPASERKSLYSRILFDADNLDAFGRVGVLRFIQFYYLKGKTIPQVLELIEKRWNGMSLKESKEMFRKDYEYTRDYFLELQKEMEA